MAIQAETLLREESFVNMLQFARLIRELNRLDANSRYRRNGHDVEMLYLPVAAYIVMSKTEAEDWLAHLTDIRGTGRIEQMEARL